MLLHVYMLVSIESAIVAHRFSAGIKRQSKKKGPARSLHFSNKSPRLDEGRGL